MPSDERQLSLADLPPAQARRRATRARKAGPRSSPELAGKQPIARVAVDISLPHLDRLFDYAVSEKQSDAALPGVRVRVRFAGQLVDGYIIERVDTTEHGGRLARLSSVVSGEQVLTPEVARLARTVADRYAGTLADVLRLAVPPRHAAVEREAQGSSPPREVGVDPGRPGIGGWDAYPTGPAMMAALEDGRSPRAAWCATPGVAHGRPSWATDVARALGAVQRSGRGAVVVVPDHRDVSYVVDALTEAGIEALALTADLGPRERYRRWLAVRRGASRFVVGTRAAVYAPVHDLALMVVWDDGDDLHAEPRAPHPHVREVAALRAHQSGCGLLVGGYTRSAEVAAMVERGFLQSVTPERSQVRRFAPRVTASGDALSDRDPLATARLPTVAWRVAREALTRGPVLVQVPRRGYVPQVICGRCRARVRCAQCHGPVGLPSSRAVPVCQWCATVATAFRCADCGHEQLGATVVGERRTAEELGRAFPGVPIVTSGGRDVVAQVGAGSALVVATPGAEPLAPEGYAAALLLDAWALLGRADLRADEEALRRWAAAAALVRGADSGGRVVVVADAAMRVVQALVRWDPVGFASQELTERQALGLPPARRFVSVTGEAGVVAEFGRVVELPEGTDAFGPVARPTRAGESLAGESLSTWMLAAAPRRELELATRVHQALGQLTVRKRPAPRVQVDPVDFAL